jgi:hypothetical protein
LRRSGPTEPSSHVWSAQRRAARAKKAKLAQNSASPARATPTANDQTAPRHLSGGSHSTPHVPHAQRSNPPGVTASSRWRCSPRHTRTCIFTLPVRSRRTWRFERRWCPRSAHELNSTVLAARKQCTGTTNEEDTRTQPKGPPAPWDAFTREAQRGHENRVPR